MMRQEKIDNIIVDSIDWYFTLKLWSNTVAIVGINEELILSRSLIVANDMQNGGLTDTMYYT